MPILACPLCAQQMTVAPTAPQKLLCPRCRGAVWNPSAGVAPRPVIPLDTQVERDLRSMRYLLPLLALTGLGGAIAYIFVALRSQVMPNVLLLFGCIIVAAGSLVALIPFPFPLGPQR